jgi:hypothetical protein
VASDDELPVMLVAVLLVKLANVVFWGKLLVIAVPVTVESMEVVVVPFATETLLLVAAKTPAMVPVAVPLTILDPLVMGPLVLVAVAATLAVGPVAEVPLDVVVELR